MRVLVLALAILLLPLRGWMGEAMALGMVQPAQQQEHAVHATGAAAHQHHAADADDASHAPAGAPTLQDCQTTCGNCQLCHSVAMTLLAALPAFSAAPRQPPAFRPAAFASAEPAAGFKPPIF